MKSLSSKLLFALLICSNTIFSQSIKVSNYTIESQNWVHDTELNKYISTINNPETKGMNNSVLLIYFHWNEKDWSLLYSSFGAMNLDKGDQFKDMGVLGSGIAAYKETGKIQIYYGKKEYQGGDAIKTLVKPSESSKLFLKTIVLPSDLVKKYNRNAENPNPPKTITWTNYNDVNETLGIDKISPSKSNSVESSSNSNNSSTKKTQDGPQKEFYPSGKLKQTYTLVKGEVVGKVTEYLESGKISKEYTYANNKLNGLYVEYHENGTKYMEVTFVEGKKSGGMTTYFDNGQIESKSFYKDDVVDGNSEIYYPNGKMCAKMKYSNGAKIENATMYNSSHSQKTEVTYVNGEDDMKGKGFTCTNENCILEKDFIGRELLMKTVYLPFCPLAQAEVKLNTMRAGMMAGIASTEKAEMRAEIDFRRSFEVNGKDTYVSILKIYSNNKWGDLKFTFTMDDGGLREYKYKLDPDEKDKTIYYVVFEEEVESIMQNFIDGTFTGITITVKNEDASGKKSTTNYPINSTKENLARIKEVIGKLMK